MRRTALWLCRAARAGAWPGGGFACRYRSLSFKASFPGRAARAPPRCVRMTGGRSTTMGETKQRKWRTSAHHHGFYYNATLTAPVHGEATHSQTPRNSRSLARRHVRQVSRQRGPWTGVKLCNQSYQRDLVCQIWSHWGNSGVPRDLEGGSTNLSRGVWKGSTPGNKRPFAAERLSLFSSKLQRFHRDLRSQVHRGRNLGAEPVQS